MSKRRLIIISDLHIGAGRLDDCDRVLESRIVSFVEKLSQGPPTELVINGDFLDFAQAPPWLDRELRGVGEDGLRLCHTETQSVLKCDVIVASHRRIFDAMSAFLVAGDHRITILPGNHDVDLFWPSVRGRLAKVIVGDLPGLYPDRLTFYTTDSRYRPAGMEGVVIEHGHQHDPANSFPKWSSSDPPIHFARDGTRRLYECVGTMFLIKYLNGLDAKYEFVDNIKPFSRFVRLFLTSGLHPRHGVLKFLLLSLDFARFLGTTDIGALLSAQGAGSIHGSWRAFVECLGEQQLDQLEREIGIGPLGMIETPEGVFAAIDRIAEFPEVLDSLESEASMLGGSPGTLTLARGYGVDEAACLSAVVNAMLERKEASIVVTGHTHVAVDEPRHKNPGCWTRYYEHGQDAAIDSWDVLSKGSSRLFPYHLRYVQVLGASPSEVELLSFEKGAGVA